MPLSEDEKRILNQIEQGFYAQDPGSARRLETTTLLRYLRRNCAWASAGFLVGLVILLAAFASSWLLGIVGFVVMIVSAIVLVQNVRKMGRHGLGMLSEELRQRRITDRLGEAKSRMRRRLRDDP